MARLPVLSSGELIKILEQQGFHKEIAPGILRSILKRTGLSGEDLLRLGTLLLGIAPRIW